MESVSEKRCAREGRNLDLFSGFVVCGYSEQPRQYRESRVKILKFKKTRYKMAENAAKSGAIGVVGSGASGGGGGDDPPRKSNMNGNRSGRFGLDAVGKGRGAGNQKSPSDSADEESKLLQQGGTATQVVKGVGGTNVDSGGGGMEEGENGDLVKARDGHGVSVIDMADGGTQPYKPVKSKKNNVFKGKMFHTVRNLFCMWKLTTHVCNLYL